VTEHHRCLSLVSATTFAQPLTALLPCGLTSLLIRPRARLIAFTTFLGLISLPCFLPFGNQHSSPSFSRNPLRTRSNHTARHTTHDTSAYRACFSLRCCLAYSLIGSSPPLFQLERCTSSNPPCFAPRLLLPTKGCSCSTVHVHDHSPILTTKSDAVN